MAKTPIDRELDRLEAETGKSRSQLFREWFKTVTVAQLREIHGQDKKQ